MLYIDKAALGASGGTCPNPEAGKSRAAGCTISWSERPAKPQAISWYRLAYLVSYVFLGSGFCLKTWVAATIEGAWNV